MILMAFFGCQSEDTEKIHEVVVIGGGLMGSSSAWHLSNQGNDVLLLEKQDSVYTQGSSYGLARIARSNNRSNDIWSYLHNHSVEETKALIQYLNTSGADNSFNMEDLYTTCPVTYVGRIGIYDQLLSSLIRQEVEYDLITSPAEAKSKLDVNLPDEVLIQREYNEHSGTLNPHQLIRHLHRAVNAKGNSIRYNSKVTQLTYNKGEDIYEIHTEDTKTGVTNSIKAEKVVCAAGPYNGTLLKDLAPYFDTLINPQRVFLAYFKIDKAVYESLNESGQEKLKTFFPVINSSTGTRSGSFFSMIEYYDENNYPVIKIGGHFQRTSIDNLDEIWNEELKPSEIDWSRNSLGRYFELLNLAVNLEDLELIDGYSCVYSLTKNEVPFVTPIIDQDGSPNHDLIVLGGMSGVGAKGSMTYGLIAANLLNQKTSRDSMYMAVEKAIGFERLLEDLKD